MEDTLSSADSLPSTPGPEMPLTISPADTSLGSPEVKEEPRSEDKKPAKKRKSWGQELPVPKTNLPPRYVVAASSRRMTRYLTGQQEAC